MSRAGVNRLSIGAQSFVNDELRAIGRHHRAAETLDLVKEAKDLGFGNISLDLVAACPSKLRIPGSTAYEWRRNWL